MKNGQPSIPAVLRNIVCAALALWVLMAAPTGWLYDLWAGVGTEQGQRPGEGVHQLQRQEDVEAFFWAGTPATITGGDLVACPLARLRDAEQEGTHYHRSYGTKRAVSVAEYIYTNSPWQRTLQGLVGRDESPTGYVRYTTTEERRMLNQMQADYDLDPVYVLDMYRHGKVNWMLDITLRLAVLLVAGTIGVMVRDFLKRRKISDRTV